MLDPGKYQAPHEGHQRFAREVNGICDKAETNGIPPVEQIAVLAQIIGQKISSLDPRLYTSTADVLESVMLNIIGGNEQAGKGAGSVERITLHG
jgi:hypothetical protein